jgi:hypothetical protein
MAYSIASLEKVEVVIKTPFFAFFSIRVPANFWISGLGTVPSQRFA